jgi:hypothetical protein
MCFLLECGNPPCLQGTVRARITLGRVACWPSDPWQDTRAVASEVEGAQGYEVVGVLELLLLPWPSSALGVVSTAYLSEVRAGLYW